ncbi:MAG TPA: lysophospholipid acyltransferase family protein [Gammaproteobacteria bacterium]|nr:lysophospholipid acyltransferase family protein [Gammaproteobacteria bacterium]
MGKLWRAFGTGLCFVLYATLTWLASMTILPLLLVWPGTPGARRRRVRRLTSASFRWLLALIAALRLGYVEVEGGEWLRRTEGKLLLATHPMYLDVVALVGLLPQADCVVKQAMWRNPFYRRFVKAVGYVGNGSGTGLMHDCVDALQRGRTLILFPEGTRSTPGEPLHFRRGAAQVAVRSQCDILPVMIRCEPLALGKGQAWYQVGGRPWRLSIKVFPPQSLASLGFRDDMPHGVAARHVNRALETFFTQQLATHEYTDRRIEAAHHRLARS